MLTRIFARPRSRARLARHAFDARLGRLVEDQFAEREVPADRPEIEDHAGPGPLHRRHGRLRREELVTQVHRHPLVPICRSHLLDRMAIVVRGIVDQHVDAAQRLLDIAHRLLERDDVGEIAMPIERRMDRTGRQPLDQGDALAIDDIDKGDARALRDKGLDQAFADAAAAAGDQHALADKAGIGCARRARLE